MWLPGPHPIVTQWNVLTNSTDYFMHGTRGTCMVCVLNFYQSATLFLHLHFGPLWYPWCDLIISVSYLTSFNRWFVHNYRGQIICPAMTKGPNWHFWVHWVTSVHHLPDIRHDINKSKKMALGSFCCGEAEYTLVSEAVYHIQQSMETMWHPCDAHVIPL